MWRGYSKKGRKLLRFAEPWIPIHGSAVNLNVRRESPEHDSSPRCHSRRQSSTFSAESGVARAFHILFARRSRDPACAIGYDAKILRRFHIRDQDFHLVADRRVHAPIERAEVGRRSENISRSIIDHVGQFPAIPASVLGTRIASPDIDSRFAKDIHILTNKVFGGKLLQY